MAKPKTITDAAILVQARRCIIEPGPMVSLAVIAKTVGLTAAGLAKRFGSKDRLLFRALLPPGVPGWSQVLSKSPSADPEAELAALLVDMAAEFTAVGPALAALRMSTVSVDDVFPADRPGPSVVVRRMLSDWLTQAGVRGDVDARADAAVGAAEARGFLVWVGPQMTGSLDDEAWAAALARWVLRSDGG